MSDLQILAQNILNQYTPLAFLCACRGTDPKCAEAMSDTYAYAQMDTVKRIYKYILDQDQKMSDPSDKV